MGAPDLRRTGIQPVLAWAALGVIVTAFSVFTFGRWLLSPDQFMPVLLPPGDEMHPADVLRIRVLEGLSSAIAVAALWFGLLRPWRRDGRAPLTGLVMLGALVSYVLDTSVNYSGWVMAWNAHAVNFGTWGAFFPGHHGPVRYAEALLWGPPMYVYFGVLLGSLQLTLFHAARKAIGIAAAAVLSFAVSFAFDLAAEAAIIVVTQAYAWAKVVGALSLWPGTLWQFPLYESFLVAVYASFYAILINAVRQGGETFVDKGTARLPVGMQGTTRTLAAFGFAAVPTLIYFISFHLISQWADTAATLPPYLLPAA